MSQTIQAVADRSDLTREILAAFQGNIEPVKEPWTYRFGIFLVTIVMIALPLIYVGLIALTAYAVYYHAVNHVGMLKAGSGRGSIFVFLAYLAPMVVGGILVLFMIKPLFARPARRPARRSLARENEPLLFAFVERICQAVGAPNPRRIDVDCEINASASFRRGLLSFLGSDLVLTIGMPLVGGLSLRQFAGVLAHEFGHFSQGAGMRLTDIIRTVSHWFTRVVYERDSWDDWLRRAAGSIDLRIGWVLYLAMLFVWLTRKILWVLMIIGHAVSGFMLRQMEFDADRHEARLAGSEVFGETCRQLTVLGVAYQRAQADLGDFYREGRLGDNLPRLILANVDQLPTEVQSKIDEHIDTSRTGALDTHPADKDRIASAQRENAPGIFQIDRPASVLFSDFDALSRHVTWDFYREIFGEKLQPSEIHPIDDLLARQNRQLDARKALDRYFQGTSAVAIARFSGAAARRCQADGRSIERGPRADAGRQTAVRSGLHQIRRSGRPNRPGHSGNRALQVELPAQADRLQRACGDNRANHPGARRGSGRAGTNGNLAGQLRTTGGTTDLLCPAASRTAADVQADRGDRAFADGMPPSPANALRAESGSPAASRTAQPNRRPSNALQQPGGQQRERKANRADTFSHGARAQPSRPHPASLVQRSLPFRSRPRPDQSGAVRPLRISRPGRPRRHLRGRRRSVGQMHDTLRTVGWNAIPRRRTGGDSNRSAAIGCTKPGH